MSCVELTKQEHKVTSLQTACFTYENGNVHLDAMQYILMPLEP